MIRDSYYLGIGIDEYPGDKRLNNAVGDVTRIRRLLEDKYGFKSLRDPLLNGDATRDNILNELNNLCNFIGKNDNVIVYFAGHGNKAPTSEAGYWEPIDFDPHKISTRIDNSSVLDLLEGIDAQHILLISDSCFSGTFLTRDRSGTSETDHDYLDSLKSGWILISGGLENVGDGVSGKGSTFNQTICRVLQRNSKPSMASGDLFEEVIRIMKESTLQSPGAAPIKRDSIHQGGQMIFFQNSDGSEGVPDFPIPEVVIQNAYLPRTLTSYSDKRPLLSFFYEPEVGNVILDDLINTQKRIVILGGAGSGKSIEMIKAMERVKASDKGLVPLFRRLNNYTDGDLDQYLPAAWKQVPVERLVVLLDGLDEIQPQFVNTVLRKISDFGERYPDITIVISSRTNFYELPSKSFSGTLSGYLVYLLNDINLHAIKNYIQAMGLDGERFVREVQDHNYLDLVQKPYFLNILFNYFHKNNDLNVRRSDVLNDALNHYFEANREQYKNADMPLPNVALVPLAERIAFVMELLGKNFITDDEISRIITQEKEYRSLRYLPAFKYDQEKEQWYFEHNNIQEYLASRILKKQNFDKMVDLLTLTSSGISKIKPTWVNTLSFMISIGQDEEIKGILDWLIKNEPEILVRFEPDRLPQRTRIAIFKQIFEYYRSLQIWLSSNKFSDKELARFGQSEETLNYLLAILTDDDSTRFDVLNTAHVLRRIEISKFKGYQKSILGLLLGLLERKDLNESDQYSLIGSLADLGFADDDTIRYLISKYAKRENQYLRAGLYKIIRRSENLDKYADVFITGLRFNHFNYQSKDRDTVTLMDELSQLKAAVKQFNKPESIRKLLEAVTVDINSVHQFFAEFKEEMQTILEHIFVAYEQDSSLFSLIATFFARHATEQQSQLVPTLLEMIDAHGIRWETLQFVLNGKGLREYEISSAAAALINEQTIEQLITQYKKGTIESLQLLQIFNNFKWRQTDWPDYDERLSLFKKSLQGATDIIFPQEPEVDRAALFKKNAQREFDLLFNPDNIKAEVKAVFKYLEKDTVTYDDLHRYKNGEYVDIRDKFSSISAELFRNFTYGNASISQATILEWIDESSQFEDFRIDAIKSRLSALPELEINKEHLSYIQSWVQRNEDTNIYTWYFIRRFKFTLPEERYLEFTRYFSPSEERDLQQGGFIELLTGFVSKDRLEDEVRSNLKSSNLDFVVWIANAGYALRNDLTDTFNGILDFIETTSQSWHRYEDLLKFWFEKTGDIDRLIKIITETENQSLKEDAIRLLLDSEKADGFLISYFQELLSKQEISEPEKLTGANYLIKLGILDGFEFIADAFLQAPSPDFDFRENFRNISKIIDPGSLDTLMKLLFFAKKPEYKSDVFNDLESLILETLFNIGIQSKEHFNAVKDHLQQFISSYKNEIPHINFLEFTITRIEDQLNVKLSREFGLEDAVKLLNSLN